MRLTHERRAADYEAARLLFTDFNHSGAFVTTESHSSHSEIYGELRC